MSFDWKYLADRPGLSHIVSNIFCRLDLETLISCDLVCSTWENLMVNNRLLSSKIEDGSYLELLYRHHIGLDLDPESLPLEEQHKLTKSFFHNLTFDEIRERWQNFNGHLKWLTKEPVSIVQISPTHTDNSLLYTSGPELRLQCRVPDESQNNASERSLASSYKTLIGHRLDISCLDSITGFCVTGSKDRKLVLWSLDTFKRLAHVNQAHDRLITGVKLRHVSDNDVIVSSSRDRTVKIWQVMSNDIELIHNINDYHTKSVWGLDVKLPHVVTASADESLKVWRFEKLNSSASAKKPKFKSVRESSKKKRKQNHDVNSLAFSDVAGENVVKYHCSFDNGAPVRNCIFLNHDSNMVLSGDILGDLNVWNVGERRHQYQVPDPKADEMFRLSGAVTTLAQSSHFVAVRFMNRGIDIFDASDPAQGLIRLTSIQSDLLSQHSRGLLMTDTEVYIAQTGGLFVAELF